MEYKRLICFDFDDTLIDTPKPETGKDIYKAKTGKDFPHVGWWSKPETLDMEIFDIKPIDKVYKEYLRAVSDTFNYVILATGRIESRKLSLRNEVGEILRKYNLAFDGIFLNTGGDTYDFKRDLFERLITELKVTEFVMYDDRIGHIIKFKEWAKTMPCDITIIDVREDETYKIKNI